MKGEKVIVVDDKGTIVLPDGTTPISSPSPEPPEELQEGPKAQPEIKLPKAVIELLARGISCVRCHEPVGRIKGSPVRRFENPFKGYVCGSCLVQTKSRVEVVRTHTGRKYGVLTDPLRAQLLEPVPIKSTPRKRASRVKKAVA